MRHCLYACAKNGVCCKGQDETNKLDNNTHAPANV